MEILRFPDDVQVCLQQLEMAENEDVEISNWKESRCLEKSTLEIFDSAWTLRPTTGTSEEIWNLRRLGGLSRYYNFYVMGTPKIS